FRKSNDSGGRCVNAAKFVLLTKLPIFAATDGNQWRANSTNRETCFEKLSASFQGVDRKQIIPTRIVFRIDGARSSEAKSLLPASNVTRFSPWLKMSALAIFDTRAEMFAFINPFNVATPSLITGTSRGATVVTRTSGAAGLAGEDLCEQAVKFRTAISPHKLKHTNFIR